MRGREGLRLVRRREFAADTGEVRPTFFAITAATRRHCRCTRYRSAEVASVAGRWIAERDVVDVPATHDPGEERPLLIRPVAEPDAEVGILVGGNVVLKALPG